MQYEIKQNEVLRVKTISTEKQPNVIIKTHHCPIFRVNIDAPATLQVNEEGTVTLQWQRFDIDLEQYVNDTTKNTPISVTVEDATAEFVTENGQATITIMSEEVGILFIRTIGSEKEVQIG